MGTFQIPIPDAVGRRALLLCVGLLALLAWIGLWLTDATLHNLVHSHRGLEAMPGATRLLLFLGGWTVMSVAMMLPTSLPVLFTFRAIAGPRRDRWLLLALVMGGYLVAWAAFGGLAYLGSRAGELLVANSPWVRSHQWATAPLLLLAAGSFQFSSLKYRCLERCRSPLSFVLSHWQGRRQRWQAFRLGVDNGVFCVGCCWALMLLMFVTGAGYFVWMLLLAMLMATEKNLAWGRRLSAPLGVGLIAGALLLIVFP